MISHSPLLRHISIPLPNDNLFDILAYAYILISYLSLERILKMVGVYELLSCRIGTNEYLGKSHGFYLNPDVS